MERIYSQEMDPNQVNNKPRKVWPDKNDPLVQHYKQKMLSIDPTHPPIFEEFLESQDQSHKDALYIASETVAYGVILEDHIMHGGEQIAVDDFADEYQEDYIAIIEYYYDEKGVDYADLSIVEGPGRSAERDVYEKMPVKAGQPTEGAIGGLAVDVDDPNWEEKLKKTLYDQAYPNRSETKLSPPPAPKINMPIPQPKPKEPQQNPQGRYRMTEWEAEGLNRAGL